MPGFESFAKAAQQAAERKAAFGDRVDFARFTTGQEYRVRFLEQGETIEWAYVHEIPALPGKVARVTPCLNQDDEGIPCYGCESGAKRLIKGWINIIMRDAPLYLKDSNGVPVKDPHGNRQVIGKADQVFVWNGGTVLFSTLASKDRAFKGLSSRDFTVLRTGDGYNTAYTVEPADADAGPQAMSAADQKLAAEKFNVRKFTTPETYEAQKALLQGVPLAAVRSAEAARVQSEAPRAGVNQFDGALDALVKAGWRCLK